MRAARGLHDFPVGQCTFSRILFQQHNAFFPEYIPENVGHSPIGQSQYHSKLTLSRLVLADRLHDWTDCRRQICRCQTTNDRMETPLATETEKLSEVLNWVRCVLLDLPYRHTQACEESSVSSTADHPRRYSFSIQGSPLEYLFSREYSRKRKCFTIPFFQKNF